jgi:hypothetical protein
VPVAISWSVVCLALVARDDRPLIHFLPQHPQPIHRLLPARQALCVQVARQAQSGGVAVARLVAAATQALERQSKDLVREGCYSGTAQALHLVRERSALSDLARQRCFDGTAR